MTAWLITALVVLALVAGGVIAWLLAARARLGERAASLTRERDDLLAEAARREAQIDTLRQAADTAGSKLAGLAAESAALTERARAQESAHADALAALVDRHRVELEAEQRSAAAYRAELERRLGQMREEFKQAIDASAARALQRSGEQLLELAAQRFASDQEKARGELDARRTAVEALVKPIADSLGQTRERLDQLGRSSAESSARLSEQVDQVRRAGEGLRSETSRLTQALRSPHIRGRYGEVVLERVLEVAGLREYCDLATQSSSRDDEGRLARPDAVVRLPNGRSIAVDSKANLDAYLDAVNADDEAEAERHLDRFARHVTEQVKALADKRYWSRFTDSPEFVVMFMPGEQLLDAALRRRTDLIELAAQSNVVLATPSTLIGLLRAVALGWREKQVGEGARELAELGRKLHERAAKILEETAAVGRGITTAANAYNALVGTLEGRLMPTLREFEERGAKSDKSLKEPPLVEVTVRPMRSLPAPAGDDRAGEPHT